MTISTAERKKKESRLQDEKRHISTLLHTASIRRDTSLFIPASTYVVLHPRIEIRSSSSSRRNTSFFIHAARYVVLHPRIEIRRFSSSRRDTSFFIPALRYVVLHTCDEIRCSSSLHRDTSFYIFAPRYLVLHPRAEIRRSSSSRRDTPFLILAPRYVLLLLSRRYIHVQVTWKFSLCCYICEINPAILKIILYYSSLFLVLCLTVEKR